LIGDVNSRKRLGTLTTDEAAWLGDWEDNKNSLRADWEALKAPAKWDEILQKKSLVELKREVLEHKASEGQ
jgi:hypothetical protein